MVSRSFDSESKGSGVEIRKSDVNENGSLNEGGNPVLDEIYEPIYAEQMLLLTFRARMNHLQWHAWELTRLISHGPTSPPQNVFKPRHTLQTDQRTRGKLTSIRMMQMEHEHRSLPDMCIAHSSLLQTGVQRMGTAGVVLHTHEPGAEKLE